MRLSPEAEAAGYRLLALDATESTNDDASRAAREGDPGKLWVVAGAQRAGRGRHGRSWVSPPGNLYASLLLIEPCEPASAPQLGFIAGLALHEAIESMTGFAAPRLALKWPNDLLLDGAKIAGILLEAQSGAGFAVIVGFGVNVRAHPPDTPYPSAALVERVPHASAAALFTELSTAFARRLESWQTARSAGAAEPFRNIREQWLARASGLGTEVSIRMPSGVRRGEFRGLDPAGRLELGTTAGVELIDAGDLYFPQFHNEAAQAAR